MLQHTCIYCERAETRLLNLFSLAVLFACISVVTRHSEEEGHLFLGRFVASSVICLPPPFCRLTHNRGPNWFPNVWYVK
jgi:hypothetical protein